MHRWVGPYAKTRCTGSAAPPPEHPIFLLERGGVAYLDGVLQAPPLVLHQVGDADGGRAAASVLAVNEGVASARRLLLDGVGAAVEVAVKILAGAVVDGDLQPPEGGASGERLLPGHVDAERHPPLLEELLAAGRAGVADGQRARDLTQLQHPGDADVHQPQP